MAATVSLWGNRRVKRVRAHLQTDSLEKPIQRYVYETDYWLDRGGGGNPAGRLARHCLGAAP